jgi:hypothetical protein
LSSFENIRGALHALQETNTSVGTARWTDIVRLQELQASEGLHADNKLTIRHVKFQQNKMNVKLAAQTMSASVASAFKYIVRGSTVAWVLLILLRLLIICSIFSTAGHYW